MSGSERTPSQDYDGAFHPRKVATDSQFNAEKSTGASGMGAGGAEADGAGADGAGAGGVASA